MLADLPAWVAGQVTEKHTEKATIESKGKEITKNGEPDNPAFKVERKGKNPVIKKACSHPSRPCANTMQFLRGLPQAKAGLRVPWGAAFAHSARAARQHKLRRHHASVLQLR